MLIGSNLSLSNLNCGPEILFGELYTAVSSSVRNLGVIFDENLLMKKQIDNVKSKAIAGLINIGKISTYINKNIRMKLVHGLGLSQLDFCISLLYKLPNYYLHPLQMIINSAARLVVNLPRFSRERITPICMELHFLPLKARMEYKICLLAYKAIKFQQPRYLSMLLKPYENSSGLELRSNGRLNEPFLSRSASISRSFEHCAPRLYNSLPADVKCQDTLSAFKRKLKTCLF